MKVKEEQFLKEYIAVDGTKFKLFGSIHNQCPKCLTVLGAHMNKRDPTMKGLVEVEWPCAVCKKIEEDKKK